MLISVNSEKQEPGQKKSLVPATFLSLGSDSPRHTHSSIRDAGLGSEMTLQHAANELNMMPAPHSSALHETSGFAVE